MPPLEASGRRGRLQAPEHCWYSHSGPAHRGICATDAVMDGPRSRIPQEARNAVYSKKAMLALMVR